MRINIYGIVGEDITANSIEQLLMSCGGEADIYINSNGGEVFEGYKIGALIRQYAPNAVARIEGNCASIATFIACSCKTILAKEGNNSPHPFMIHNPFGEGISGDSISLTQVVDELKRIEAELKLAYTIKSGLKDKELTELMANETTFSIEEAIKNGFIDGYYSDSEELIEANKKVVNYVNILNMEKNEQDISTLSKVLNAISDKLNLVSKKILNFVDTTEEGSQVFIDAASIEEAVGASVYSAIDGESTGELVQDGTYNLESGFIITVLDGVISEIVPMDMEAKAKDQEIAALKEQLKQKEEEIEAFNAQIQSLEDKVSVINAKLSDTEQRTIKAQTIKKPVIVNESTVRVKGITFK